MTELTLLLPSLPLLQEQSWPRVQLLVNDLGILLLGRGSSSTIGIIIKKCGRGICCLARLLGHVFKSRNIYIFREVSIYYIKNINIEL